MAGCRLSAFLAAIIIIISIIIMCINIALCADAESDDFIVRKSIQVNDAGRAVVVSGTSRNHHLQQEEQIENLRGNNPSLINITDSSLTQSRAGNSAPETAAVEKSATTADGSSSSSLNSTALNEGFLNLFDELLRIKNSSRNALVRLNYFKNNKTTPLVTTPSPMILQVKGNISATTSSPPSTTSTAATTTTAASTTTAAAASTTTASTTTTTASTTTAALNTTLPTTTVASDTTTATAAQKVTTTGSPPIKENTTVPIIKSISVAGNTTKINPLTRTTTMAPTTTTTTTTMATTTAMATSTTTMTTSTTTTTPGKSDEPPVTPPVVLVMGAPKQDSNHQQPALGRTFTLSIHSWVAQLNMGLNRLLAKITRPLTAIHTPAANVVIPRESRSESMEGNKEEPEEKPAEEGSKRTGSGSAEHGSRAIVKREANPTEAKQVNEQEVTTTTTAPTTTTAAATTTATTTTTTTTTTTVPTLIKANRCVDLDVDQTSKCRSTETLIGDSLGSSFPGTSEAIEENCHHISFLLANCWPRVLRSIKASLPSWNESMLAATDFPMPSEDQVAIEVQLPVNSSSSSLTVSVAPQQQQQEAKGAAQLRGVSCGVGPKLGEYLLERITWMWLNLCMDKKFRNDYLENMKCLALWTYDRAQLSCSNEYKRMQVNINSTETGGSSSSQMTSNGAGKSSGSGRQKSNQSGGAEVKKTALANQDNSKMANNNNGAVELVDRELESKVLCCLFDTFLRCVHRQAVRDCGRSGGQFVVSFMARIGKDDMKFLCNNEPLRSSIHPPRVTATKPAASTTNSRKGMAILERGPFIEYNYCIDPRINAVLHSSTDRTRQEPSIQATQKTSLGNSNRNRNNATKATTSSNQSSDFNKPDSDASIAASISILCHLLTWFMTIYLSAAHRYII